VLTWVVATRPGSNLLAEGIDPVAARGRRVSFGLGVIVYVGLCGLSFVLPWLVVAAHLATASYYLVDQLPLDRIAVPSPPQHIGPP
jgi:ribose/xylose/arabinose/galactoside ABC-type transport system permease subunit